MEDFRTVLVVMATLPKSKTRAQGSRSVRDWSFLLGGGSHHTSLAALVMGRFPLQDRCFAATVGAAPAEWALYAAVFKLVQVSVGADVGFVITVASCGGLFSWPIHAIRPSVQ